MAHSSLQLHHRVPGGGGSNLLVPTKIPLKNQPVMLVFYARYCCGKTGGIIPTRIDVRSPGNYHYSYG
ncbi:hypothetical protein DNK65_08735 [Citrobacter koseri]|nr:hypothetical protein DNK65_08735 [Citrobacter koseri]